MMFLQRETAKRITSVLESCLAVLSLHPSAKSFVRKRNHMDIKANNIVYFKHRLLSMILQTPISNSTDARFSQIYYASSNMVHLLGHDAEGLSSHLDSSRSVKVDLGEVNLHAHLIVGIAGLLAGVFCILFTTNAATVIEHSDNWSPKRAVHLHANRADTR